MFTHITGLCNAKEREEDGNWCNANDGYPCEDCEAKQAAELASYGVPPPNHFKTDEEYREEMRDAGRGHLVRNL